MATAKANVDVSVTGVQALDNLVKKVQGVNTAFSSLKSKLAAVGLVAFGRSALLLADDLNDLSNATGIAIARLVEFRDVFVTVGGTADQMSAGVVKFTQSIDDAAQGSLKAQNAFAELGINLEDLRTLSEQDLLLRTLEGFDKVNDKSREAALKMDIFGKSFKTVDPKEFADKLNAAAGSGDRYAQSIKQAADLNDKLTKTANDLKVAFLQVTAPLVNFINIITDQGQNIERLVTILKVLGTVLLAVFGGAIAMSIVRFFGMIARGIAAIGPALTQAGNLLKSFGPAAEAGAGVAARAFAPTSKLMTALRGVMALAGTVAGALAGVFGLGGNQPEPTTTPTDTKGQEKESEAARQVTDALAKKRKEIEFITEAFKSQNNQLIDNINIEKMLIGKSQEEAEIIKAQEEIYKRAADETEKLRKAKELLGDDEKKLIPIYDAQIAAIAKQSSIDAERIASSMQGLQGLKLLEQDRINNLDRINQALQKQIQYDQSLLQIRQQAGAQLQEAQFEQAQMGRSPLEKQFAQIQENARKAALEASRAFAEQFNMEDMGAEDAKKLADGLDLIAQKYKEIAEVQAQNLLTSRTFAQGWKEAFDDYMDNATNAANRGREAFSAFTTNMNSAIDNFVNTGKFKFGDFARSIIQDLLRIELKAQATQLFKAGIGGLGSLFSGIGSLFGFAEGGNPPINKPSIVGEKGPELFVPKTAGTVVPNNQLNAPQSQPTITNIYNVSAIDARSVQTFFAENRKTMLGSIQLAQKELPYGNR